MLLQGIELVKFYWKPLLASLPCKVKKNQAKKKWRQSKESSESEYLCLEISLMIPHVFQGLSSSDLVFEAETNCNYCSTNYSQIILN